MTRPLETGWLPDTPVGDTLLRRFVHNQAEHNEAMAAAHGGRIDRTDDVCLADTAAPVPYLNQAILTRPLASADDSALDTAEAFFAGRSGVTLLSIWPTPDLSGRGWALAGHPALVVRAPGPVPSESAPSTSAPSASVAAAPAPAAAGGGSADGVEVRRVATAADLEVAERIAIEGYPLEGCAGAAPGSIFPPALVESGIAVRLGVLDGVPVAVGNVFVGHGLVNLALGATLPAARRRGVWEALVWARLSDGPDLPAVAYTSDFSRPGFVRMGFLPITRFTLWWR